MDWIKVEKSPPDKPELLHIADRCRCSQAEAFLAWFRLWVWLDNNSADGTVDLLTKTKVDALAGLNGLGDAMEEVGWIVFTEGNPPCATIANWGRHNGQSAKARALAARRVADMRYRRNAASVTPALRHR
jgi:hypothetical protein